MVSFIVIKVHYDHRARLSELVKYTQIPTVEEYQNYLDIFQGGAGGNGFHECLNFNSTDEDVVKIYLPPTCIPKKSKLNDEFIIFSCTYKDDEERPSEIVGVHAGVRIVNRDGIPRHNLAKLENTDALFYHAECPAELATLLIPSLPYDATAGRYMPILKKYGCGLRYIDENNVANIIEDVKNNIAKLYALASSNTRHFFDRELLVLNEISSKYFGTEIVFSGDLNAGNELPIPDKELGKLGEQWVYEKELDYAATIGAQACEIEWVSQGNPISTYDIKSVRKTRNGHRQHFIEVKSSRSNDYDSIFISAEQVEFFEKHQLTASFKFVTFNFNNDVVCVREFTLDQLKDLFDFLAIKYRLKAKLLGSEGNLTYPLNADTRHW